MGIRLAQYVVERLRRRGDDVELIDAKAINLPILDRMYKEYPKGQAPEALETLAGKIRAADGFVFVTGEYNWGVQPGLKNLTDHFLEEWFWRPAAIVSYSAGRLSGARAATAWHGTLSEMGMVVISSTIGVGPIGQTLSAEGEPVGEGGQALEKAFPRFADDLMWWVEAAKAQRSARRLRIEAKQPTPPRTLQGDLSMNTTKLMFAAVLAASIAAPIAGFLRDTKAQPMTSSGVQVPFLHGFSIGPSVSQNELASLGSRTSG